MLVGDSCDGARCGDGETSEGRPLPRVARAVEGVVETGGGPFLHDGPAAVLAGRGLVLGVEIGRAHV